VAEVEDEAEATSTDAVRCIWRWEAAAPRGEKSISPVSETATSPPSTAARARRRGRNASSACSGGKVVGDHQTMRIGRISPDLRLTRSWGRRSGVDVASTIRRQLRARGRLRRRCSRRSARQEDGATGNSSETTMICNQAETAPGRSRWSGGRAVSQDVVDACHSDMTAILAHRHDKRRADFSLTTVSSAVSSQGHASGAPKP
jgi:hypothetical protein